MLTSSFIKNNPVVAAWLVVLTASLFFFYIFIQMNLFNTMDVELMQAFHLNAPQLGQLSAMFFYADAAFVFPAGILLDRFSVKKLLSCAAVLATLATLTFALTENYLVAGVGRLLVGSSAAFSFLSCVRLASHWFIPQKRALVIGIVVTMAMLGGLVAQTPMAMLIHSIGWRYALRVDAGIGILISLMILLIVRDYPAGVAVNPKPLPIKNRNFGQEINLVLFNKNNWLAGLYAALLNLPVFLLGALWGIHYLVQVHHLKLVQASYPTTLFFLGVIIGSPAFGWLSDYIGRRILPMIVGAILSLAAILLLMCLANLSLSMLMLWFFLVGFLTSSQVLIYPTIAELNPPALTSTAVGISSVIIMCSGFIFQPLFGWIMEWHLDHSSLSGEPIYLASHFFHAMLIMPIACGISLFVALFIKETYCDYRV
jgi:MFS family permease